MCLRLLVLTAPKTSLALNRSQLATDLLRYLLAPLHPVTDTDSTVSNPLSEPQHPSAGGRCLCVCARAATNSLGPCLSTELWQPMTRLDGDSHHNCMWLYAGFQSRLSGSKSGNSSWFIDGARLTRHGARVDGMSLHFQQPFDSLDLRYTFPTFSVPGLIAKCEPKCMWWS